ncbi:MAG: helix-turn-helix transcriptional regulator [Clostridia bacterium]|nr:helix-turn-helix transcriptional regulator [Clostridia bacterium]
MKLKEIRKQHNKTQVEVAKYLNITQEKYSRLESEKSKVDVDTLIALANYYKVTVDELIGYDVPYLINKSDFSNEQLTLIEKIKNLSVNQCIQISAYIDGVKDGKK